MKRFCILVLLMLIPVSMLSCIQQNINIEITVYDGEVAQTFTISTGMIAEIDEYTKPDYYLLGYFDQSSGGTKYFKASGVSLAEWEEKNPTTFYAQWGSLEDIEYIKGPEYTETPLLVDDSDTIVWEKHYLKYSLAEETELMNAVKGNPDHEVEILLEFSIISVKSWSDMTFILQDTDLDNGKSFGVRAVTTDYSCQKYTNCAFTYVCEANVMQYGMIVFSHESYVSYHDYYLKNIKVSVHFIED